MRITGFKAFGDGTEVRLRPGENTVTGPNGSGKTSIFKAYTWCLFGTDENGKTEDVFPRGATDIETPASVEVTLLVDGVPVTVKRTKWRKESQKAGKDQRYWNGVACTLTVFNNNLTGIVPVARWKMLSSVYGFVNLDMRDRRFELGRVVSGVDGVALCAEKGLHIVGKAIQDGVLLEDLGKSLRRCGKAAQAELDGIGGRIATLEEMKVGYDFTAAEEELAKLTEEASALDGRIASAMVSGEAGRIAELRRQALEIECSVQREHTRADVELKTARLNVSTSIQVCERDMANKKNDLLSAQRMRANAETMFDNAKAGWMAEKTRAFTFDNTACPTCGRAFDEDTYGRAKADALRVFNATRKERMAALQKSGEDAAAMRDEAVKREEAIVAGLKAVSEEMERLREKLEQLCDRHKRLPSPEVAMEANKEYRAIQSELSALSSKGVDGKAVAALKEEKSILSSRMDELRKQIAMRDVNKDVDVKIQQIEESRAGLREELANVEAGLEQIRAYVRANAEALSANADNVFENTRWRFLRENVTNGEFTDICEPLRNGVEYACQNMAEKINMGIEIIRVLSKPDDVSIPLFVDQSESVNPGRYESTGGQMIRLIVSDEGALKVNGERI